MKTRAFLEGRSSLSGGWMAWVCMTLIVAAIALVATEAGSQAAPPPLAATDLLATLDKPVADAATAAQAARTKATDAIAKQGQPRGGTRAAKVWAANVSAKANAAKQKAAEAMADAADAAKAHATLKATADKTAATNADAGTGVLDAIANVRSLAQKATTAATDASTLADTAASGAALTDDAVAKLDDAGVSAACNTYCSAANTRVLCLRADTGVPLCKDRGLAPGEINAGDTVTVRVLQAEGDTGTFTLSISTPASVDSLFPPASTAPNPALREAPSVTYKVAQEQKSTAPSDGTHVEMDVTLTPTGEPPVVYRIDINQGKYYLEIGVLTAFVPGGSRTVKASPMPGGGEQRLAVVEDWLVSPALALDLFPGGRRRGRFSSFSHYGPQSWGDALGVQFAVDLTQPTQRFYFGGVFEPIAGASVDAGLALVKGDYVPANYAAGMLVPSGETFTPDSKFAPRFYFGVTFTLDILTSITAARNGLSGVQF